MDESAEAYYASVIGTRSRGSGQANVVDETCAFEEEERGVRVHYPIGGPFQSEPESSEDIPDKGGGQYRQQGIGYQLLRRAGWKGSGGLGAQEQGVASPIAAWKQSGRQGIGSQTAEHQKKESSAPVPHSSEDVSSRRTVRVGEEPPGKQSRRAPKREWESVRVEEPVDVKVKRWRQVMQAETDERVSKAIDRYMFRAFRDDESDSNPLLRKNNLSVSNPLL